MISNDRNFHELFYMPLPDGLVSAKAAAAIGAAADVCAELGTWAKEDLLSDRLDELCHLVDRIRSQEGASDDLHACLDALPAAMTLEEAYAYLSADRDDDRRKVLTALAARLGSSEPDLKLVPDRVQVLTMHSAKGLAATAGLSRSPHHLAG